MAKRPSLAESMRAVTPTPVAGEAKPYFAATREGKKRITVLVSKEEHKRLKRLAVDLERPLEDIVREAIDEWCLKHPEA
jgi:hypothetical protein